ncbi:uncharacterized protein LOC120105112 [Phoenix dactylifera]|uniref:Uncharacterized protein LOC120105112 n=1 Tax=Phoenix dactylifera TaxID=42345 RepID=A0A8B8ZIR0_PHODC|nr:uncharacterized protein LOC120105112 [Phoenix dactylifera]
MEGGISDLGSGDFAVPPAGPPVPAPAAAAAAAAPGEVSPYPVPRILREANLGRPPPGSRGYHPAVALSLAAAHRWAPYDSFMSALRDLMLADFQESISRSNARESLSSLTHHHVPFAACRRFPDDKIYVCIDRAPISFLVLRLNRALAMDRKEGKEYYDAVQDAMNVVMSDDVSSPPVIYNRNIFESVFQLQWIE